MPYSGENDTSLPSNVRRQSPRVRRMWIHAYDSARNRGMDEGAAMQLANGVIRTELGRRELPEGMMPLVDIPESEWLTSDEFDAFLTEMALARRELPLVDRILDKYGLGLEGLELAQSPSTDFDLRQMPDGRVRFFSFASNNFVDRGKLVFPEAAQREYVDWVERTGQYPELWLWHARGSALGQVDKVWFDGHMQVSSGLIHEGKEELAFELASRDDLGMSHGYIGKHVERPDGTVEVVQFREFEQSILPHKVAANFGTYFGVFGQREEKLARFSQEQRDWLRDVAHASPDDVARMEQLTTEMQDRFKAVGIDWRSLNLEDGEPVVPAPVVPADPATPTTVPAPAATPADPAQAAAGAQAAPATAAATQGGVTEADVRRIIAETITPLTTGIESLTGTVRELRDATKQSDDDRFANQYQARARSLPQGFRASQQGAAPEGAMAAGARQQGGMKLHEIMQTHPLLRNGEG